MPDPTPTPSPSPGPEPPPESPDTGPGTDPKVESYPYRDRLDRLLKRRQKAIAENDKQALRKINNEIEQVLRNHPNDEDLWDSAESAGYNIDRALKEEKGKGEGKDAVDTVVDEAQGSGDPTDKDKGKGDGEKAPNLKGQAADNRLLGEEGKHYVIRRTPKGGYMAVYSFRIDGQVKKIAVQIPRGRLGRYGVKEGQGKLLTKAQLKNIENIGWADELAPHVRQGDGHMVKALERYLRNQYGGNPMLRNDEVMGKVIANSLFGWTPGEFENQLRNTKWYQNTNEWQRTWDTTMSDKERQNIVSSTRQKVVNALEDNYGFDYLKHVTMDQVKRWVDQISSGRWGTPDEGLEFWSENQFDKASKIENTPAWIARQKQQEADKAFLNRPENKSEALRQDMVARFGRTILGKKERDAWAADIISETRSAADWEEFMRQQQRTLYSYFDPDNGTFVEQASPFKEELELTLGTPVGWDHKLLSDFSRLDDNGKPTGDAMSLYDFRLKARDPNFNPAAYQQGTPLFDEGMDQLGDFLKRMKGAA